MNPILNDFQIGETQLTVLHYEMLARMILKELAS